ncbi:MAG: FG-GAP repeat protein [Polyangiaceae bacterium]|nr:FG-GAP repeat protein [Polyangiaceae bacterium]
MRARWMLALCFLTASCSWSRYDALTKDPPVVLLERPSSVGARFGATLGGGDDVLLTGGQPAQAGVALFVAGDPPAPLPATATCTDLARCRSTATPAYLPSLPGKTRCFVAGIGRGEASLDDSAGLVGTCLEGGAFKLPVPEPFKARVIEPALVPFSVLGFEGVVALASADGRLGAASPETREAWLYDPGGASFAVLPRPAYAVSSYGTTVAMVGGARPTFAVAAPADGQVILHDPASGAVRGCVKRAAPWGVVMTAFVDAGRSWLAVSDGAGRVDVLDLAALALDPGACVDPGAAARSVACAETEDLTGCSGAAFGYSLAHGDLDGDGDQELIVGAPGANVRDVPNAGAVFVFDQEGGDAPRDVLFLGAPGADDQLGAAVATTRTGAHDVVAAGLPGTRKAVAVFLCGMSPGARCQ